MVETLIDCANAKHLKADVQGKGKPHGEIDRQFLDSSQAHQVLGWKPRTTLSSGLRHTIRWFKTHARPLNLLTSGSVILAGEGGQLLAQLPL